MIEFCCGVPNASRLRMILRRSRHYLFVYEQTTVIKKQYASPKMKTVMLKQRINLLEDSAIHGELGYNQTYVNQNAPKV